LVGIPILPQKADSKLIVDTNAVLSGAISPQTFQVIAWWHGELAQVSDPIELRQFSPSDRPQHLGTCLSSPTTPDAIEQVLGGRVREGTYHAIYYNGCRSKEPIEMNGRGELPICRRGA
jgi:hypothetical protein